MESGRRRPTAAPSVVAGAERPPRGIVQSDGLPVYRAVYLCAARARGDVTVAEEFENYEAMVEAAQRAIDDSEVRTGLSIDPFAPAGMMLQQMQRGELSSEELLRTHIRRIEARNPALHAIVSPLFDDALIAARRGDRGRCRG